MVTPTFLPIKLISLSVRGATSATVGSATASFATFCTGTVIASPMFTCNVVAPVCAWTAPPTNNVIPTIHPIHCPCLVLFMSGIPFALNLAIVLRWVLRFDYGAAVSVVPRITVISVRGRDDAGATMTTGCVLGDTLVSSTTVRVPRNSRVVTPSVVTT